LLVLENISLTLTVLEKGRFSEPWPFRNRMSIHTFPDYSAAFSSPFPVTVAFTDILIMEYNLLGIRSFLDYTDTLP